MDLKTIIALILTLSFSNISLSSSTSTNLPPPRHDRESHDYWVKTFKNWKTIPQPYTGEMVILLTKAIEIHKKEINVPLENYKLAILDGEDYFDIWFIDFRGALIRGSRDEVPSFHVHADKKTYEIIRYGRDK
jgi:hypothetical protein